MEFSMREDTEAARNDYDGNAMSGWGAPEAAPAEAEPDAALTPAPWMSAASEEVTHWSDVYYAFIEILSLDRFEEFLGDYRQDDVPGHFYVMPRGEAEFLLSSGEEGINIQYGREESEWVAVTRVTE